MNNKGADQLARMCRLICTFVVHGFAGNKAHICDKYHYLVGWPGFFHGEIKKGSIWICTLSIVIVLFLGPSSHPFKKSA